LASSRLEDKTLASALMPLFWPQFCNTDLGLDLDLLALASRPKFWPHLAMRPIFWARPQGQILASTLASALRSIFWPWTRHGQNVEARDDVTGPRLRSRPLFWPRLGTLVSGQGHYFGLVQARVLRLRQCAKVQVNILASTWPQVEGFWSRPWSIFGL